jgi:hypothetical protein
VLLLDIDRQREEVDIPLITCRRGAEHHGVAGSNDHGAARLTGELSGLEGDLVATYLHRDAAHVEHAHMLCFPSGRPVGDRFWLQNSRSLSARW